MEKLNNQWKHFTVFFEKENSNKFIIHFLNEFKSISYFDRIAHNQGYSFTLHIMVSCEEINKKIIKFIDLYKIKEINSYSVENDISDLFYGPEAESLYLQFSLMSSDCLSEWLSLIESRQTTLSALAYSIMSLYVLHPENKKSFFCKNSHESVPLSFLSFRSHSDGYLIRMNNENHDRKKMEAMYQENKETYTKRFEQLKKAYQLDTLPSEIKKWAELMDRMFLLISQTIKDNKIYFKEDQFGYIADAHEVSVENFHLKTRKNFILYRYLRKNKKMKVFRLVTGMMYLLLHRLGLSYLERNCFCFIISRTVEDLFKINIDSAIGEFKKSIIKYYFFRFVSLRFFESI